MHTAAAATFPALSLTSLSFSYRGTIDAALQTVALRSITMRHFDNSSNMSEVVCNE